MKRVTLVFPILAIVLVLSLIGCGGTESNPTQWGTYGTGDGEFSWPEGIAVASDGNVYVADKNNYRIQKFTSEGRFVSKWGTEGTDDGEFDYPAGVAVASDGSVYVADIFNNRIQKFLPGN